MANRQRNRCSTWLRIREIQITTTREISPHTSQKGHHQKYTNKKRWRRYREKVTLLHCWWECELVQPLWRAVLRVLIKLKIELPTIPLLGMYPEKNMIQKDARTPVFIAVLFTITKTWKPPECPLTYEWIKKIRLRVKVTQSCPTLCDSMDYSHGILQARTLEWAAFPFSRGSSYIQ